jgi:hypothetical protein
MIAMALLYLMNENVKLMTRDEKIKLINAYITSNKSKLDGGRRTRKLKLKRNININRNRK